MSDQIEQQASEPTTEQPVQLQLADLLLAAQVIQLASTRGAIKPEEMTQVGGLYERLVKFLQQSGALQPAREAGADAQAPAAE